MRTFADPPPLLKLLAELRKRRKEQQEVDDKLDAYLQAILVAMSRAPEQAESTKELMRQEGLDPLTEHELQIPHLFENGLTNREIASELVVTPGTIKLHMFIGHVVLPQKNEGDQIVNKYDNGPKTGMPTPTSSKAVAFSSIVCLLLFIVCLQ